MSRKVSQLQEFQECSPDIKLEIDTEIKKDSGTEIRQKLLTINKDIVETRECIKTCQLRLEKQDEELKNLQEQIAKHRANVKNKEFDWSGFQAASLISKIFEFCEPVPSSALGNNGDSESYKKDSKKFDETPKAKSRAKDKGKRRVRKPEKESVPKAKCLYTADFHRFAIALYFFSPRTYFFLSHIAPMFPNRSYIQQWITSGKVEKLFPPGVNKQIN